ncbi:MAG TPA: DUF4124 domain-containing protein [Gammaproteobacteria bacterium]
MSRIFAMAAAVIFAMQALPVAAGTVYKCTTADGKTIYSGQPCPETARSETLNVPEPATPDESAKTGDGKSLDERIAEATDPVIKAQLEIQKQRCELARTQLERYADAPYLIEKREDGTERQLSEEETKAAREKLRQQIENRCS